MRDSYGTYDGSKPEPPYECLECADLAAKLQAAEARADQEHDISVHRAGEIDRLQAEVARLQRTIGALDEGHERKNARIAELENFVNGCSTTVDAFAVARAALEVGE